MRVLLSALALTALLLLAGAASVLAADGALPGDVSVTLDPTQPTPTPTPDTSGSAVETVTQTAEPATQPVVEAAAPVIAAVADAAAPAAGPVGDAAEPIVDVVAPVAAPITDVVAPAADVLDPVVSPIAAAVDPVTQPIVDVVDPVIGPIVGVVGPIVDPGTDPVPPVTDPGVGGVDPTGLAGVPAPAFDPNSLLSGDVAWFDGDNSFGSPPERTTRNGLVALATGIARAETGAPGPGSPGDLPWQGAPFGLPSGGAGPGGALSVGAWIALLTAGLLAIVFYAFRRPWSSVPTLRGRSLLPALRPA
jgi:hypothetical protein